MNDMVPSVVYTSLLTCLIFGDLLQLFAPLTVSSIMFNLDWAPLIVVALTAVFYFFAYLVIFGSAAKILKVLKNKFNH